MSIADLLCSPEVATQLRRKKDPLGRKTGSQGNKQVREALADPALAGCDVSCVLHALAEAEEELAAAPKELASLPAWAGRIPTFQVSGANMLMSNLLACVSSPHAK